MTRTVHFGTPTDYEKVNNPEKPMDLQFTLHFFYFYFTSRSNALPTLQSENYWSTHNVNNSVFTRSDLHRNASHLS